MSPPDKNAADIPELEGQRRREPPGMTKRVYGDADQVPRGEQLGVEMISRQVSGSDEGVRSVVVGVTLERHRREGPPDCWMPSLSATRSGDIS